MYYYIELILDRPSHKLTIYKSSLTFKTLIYLIFTEKKICKSTLIFP